MGEYLSRERPRFRDRSLVAVADRAEIPVTVHVAVGTDIIHMHPQASGAAIGDASLRDFRYFTSCVAQPAGRRVPELRIRGRAARGVPQGRGARAQPGRRLEGLTTVNIDFLRMYRPQTNVVTRPVAGTDGVGISLVGHHEILIPLIAAAVIEAG